MFKFSISAPNPPRNISVKEIDVNKVLISWSPPLVSQELIKGYRIYYSPPLPAIKKTVSASNNNLLIDNTFEVGVKYYFWVTTLTTSLESENSNKSSLVIGSINTIKDLNSKNITNSSVTIEWHSVPDRKIKWFIEYRCDDYFIGYVNNVTTDRTEVTVEGLSPGVNYQFKVLPIINGSVLLSGIEDNTISIVTHGLTLPSVVITGKSALGTNLNLSWISPKYMSFNQINWEYGVYYGIAENKLKLYLKTNDTNVTIKDLFSCESYIIQVRVTAPFGIGPSIGSTVLETQYDPLAQPKNLKYRVWQNNRTQYLISWNSSCYHMIGNMIGYKISVNNVVKNREDFFQLAPRYASSVEMNLTVHFGAVYDIKVSTDQENARFSETIRLKPIALPQVLKLDGVLQFNDSLYIVWKTIDNWPPELQNHRLEFINNLKCFLEIYSNYSRL